MSRFSRTLFRWTQSKVPTSLMPLADISQVTVLLDGDAPDAPDAGETIRGFFAARGIQLIVVPVFKKKPVRVHRDTQVLLSLLPWNSFRLEFIIRRSRARFKIGRVSIPDDILDLVVSDPEGKPYPQLEVFNRIMEIVEGLE